MLIEGPLKIAIAEPEDGEGRILVMGFTPEFRALDLAGQGDAFRDYLAGLNESIASDAGIDARNRAGMMIVRQIVEQLLPHVVAGELDLEQSMTVQIRRTEQASALADLLDEGPA